MVFFRILRKFRQILNRHQKIRVIELGVIMVIGGFLEMLSVSLIMPFMEAVMKPEELMANPVVKFVCGVFGIESHRTFLVLLAIFLALIYVLKNVFLVFQMRVQNRFVWNNMFSTQQRLLANYLSRPYEYFLKVSSGDVLRVIENDTQGTFNLLSSLLSFTTETVVSAILVVTIFVISPMLTLLMGALLFGIMIVILKVLRPMLRKSGIKNQNSNSEMKKWLLQSIQGVKELKIMRREKFFQDNYGKSGQIYVKTVYNHNTLGQIPRFLIEALSMGAIFIMIALMIYQGAELETVVPVLSSIAVAAIRLLPSVNRISSNVASMTFQEPMLDKMIENLNEVYTYDSGKTPEGEGKIDGLKEVIELDQIRYRYPSGEKDILCGASMTIKRGMSIGIVGASGAGKTTAVDIMLGLLRPQEGKVMIDGTDIQLDMDGWLSEIGYIPQQIFMLDGSIRDNVVFGLPEEEIHDDQVWKALRDSSLEDFVKSLPEGLDTEIGERGVRLSGGQRQRIGIARALYANPSVLFFDEATSALDNETEAAIMESIHHLKGTKTMIIIAHRLTTIEGCDAVFRVQDQKLLRER